MNGPLRRARNQDQDFEGSSITWFRVFVAAGMSLLVGLHVYAYLWGPQDIATSISDLKLFVMQLSREMAQVHHKHQRLQAEVERVSSVLPGMVAAAGRAGSTFTPVVGKKPKHDLADYDRQMGDYALESAGARVVDTGDTVGHFNFESPVSWLLHALTAWACHECQAARAIIQPGSLPGECWAFKGDRGEAVIRLVGNVLITGVTVEHIPPHIDPTGQILSAPRQFKLEGLRSRTDPKPYDFGTFEYNKNGKPIQYFDVAEGFHQPQGFNLVRFKVLSNWGHPVYTCLNHEQNIKKMRILSFMQMAESNPDITFDEIITELQIEEKDVEAFIIQVLKTKLVRARMDGAARTVRVSSTMHRTFGPAQWQQLRAVLAAWRANLLAAHDSINTVATAQLERLQHKA